MFRLTGGDERIFMNFKEKPVKNRQNHIGAIQFSLVFAQGSLIFFDLDGILENSNRF